MMNPFEQIGFDPLMQFLFSSEGNTAFAEFYNALKEQLDNISDEQLKEMKDLLKYWNEEEDFDKMDKLTIVYRYKQMP